MGFTLPKITGSLPKPSIMNLGSVPALPKPSLSTIASAVSVGGIVGAGAVIASQSNNTIGNAIQSVASQAQPAMSKVVETVKADAPKVASTLTSAGDKVKDEVKKDTTLAVSEVKKGASVVGSGLTGMFDMVLFAGGAVVLGYLLLR